MVLSSAVALAVDKVCSTDPCIGTSGADLLIGTAGNETINGLAGSDQLIGGKGNDFFGPLSPASAGAGSDTYSFADGFGAGDFLIDAGPATDKDTIDFSKVTSSGSIRAIPEPTWDDEGYNEANSGGNKVKFGATTTIEKMVGSSNSDQLNGGKQTNTYVLSAGGSDTVFDYGGFPGSTYFTALPASNDTYTGYKSGALYIADYGGSGDVLDLKPLKTTDVHFEKDGDNLVLRSGPSANDTVTISNQFTPQNRIEKIVFANRTITSIAFQ